MRNTNLKGMIIVPKPVRPGSNLVKADSNYIEIDATKFASMILDHRELQDELAGYKAQARYEARHKEGPRP